VQTLKLEGVHLCCGKCVSVVDKAVKSVPGCKRADRQEEMQNLSKSPVTSTTRKFLTRSKRPGLTGKVAKLKR